MSGFQVKVNCTVHWAFLKKLAPMAKKYEVVLGNLSDEAVTNLRGAGIKVHNKPDDKPEQGRYVTCRSTLPMKAEDQKGQEIEALIGNGSRAIATVGIYDWDYEGRKGKSPTLYKLVITNLVEVARKEQAPV